MTIIDAIFLLVSFCSVTLYAFLYVSTRRGFATQDANWVMACKIFDISENNFATISQWMAHAEPMLQSRRRETVISEKNFS